MIFNQNDDVEMDMPTPCQNCGRIFELHDGCGSRKWHPGTVICEDCGKEEDEEIALDEEISDLKEAIADAETTIKESKERLMELGVKT